MKTPHELRREAERFRRLATDIDDRWTIEALRELAAVTEVAAFGAAWCWATQAADALVATQKLVTEAIAAGADVLDPEALAVQVHRYRSAAQIGLPMRFSPIKRMAVKAVQTASIVVLP